MRASWALWLCLASGCGPAARSFEGYTANPLSRVSTLDAGPLPGSAGPVGYLVDRWGEPHCSAVLVAPRLVLTAAHCSQGPSILRFGVGAVGGRIYEPQLISPGELFAYGKLHPRYDGTTYDLMYLLLDQPVTETSPAQLADFSSLSARCGLTGAGYGQPAIAADGTPTIRWEYRGVDVCAEPSLDSNGWIRATSPLDSLCVGDSGGGLMTTGEDRLIGLVKSGNGPCGPGAVTNFEPIERARAFIEEGLALAAP